MLELHALSHWLKEESSGYNGCRFLQLESDTSCSDGQLSIGSFQGSEAISSRTGGWVEATDPDGVEAVLFSEEGWAEGLLAPALLLELVSIVVNSVTRVCICGS